MFPVWAEAWSDHCVWLLSSLKRLSWKVSTWRFCQSPSGLNWILLKKTPIKRFLLWPFLEEDKLSIKRNIWPLTCGQLVATEFVQELTTRLRTALPSANMAAIQETHHFHTHTLHPHVDRNTHSRNNVTSKTGYRWLQWWETSNDLRKKKNVIFMCDLCKRSAVLFLLTEAQLYFWYLSL